MTCERVSYNLLTWKLYMETREAVGEAGYEGGGLGKIKGPCWTCLIWDVYYISKRQWQVGGWISLESRRSSGEVNLTVISMYCETIPWEGNANKEKKAKNMSMRIHWKKTRKKGDRYGEVTSSEEGQKSKWPRVGHDVSASRRAWFATAMLLTSHTSRDWTLPLDLANSGWGGGYWGLTAVNLEGNRRRIGSYNNR